MKKIEKLQTQSNDGNGNMSSGASLYEAIEKINELVDFCNTITKECKEYPNPAQD